MNPELREKKPSLAETIERLQGSFQRAYDLSENREKADFVEGLREFAVVIATTSASANLKIETGANGITSLQVIASPTP